MKQRLVHIVFVTAFVLCALPFALSLALPQTSVLLAENRAANRYAAPTLQAFFDGSYHSSLELANADQLPGSAEDKTQLATWRQGSFTLLAELPKLLSSGQAMMAQHDPSLIPSQPLELPDAESSAIEFSQDGYEQVAKDFYTYNDAPWLIKLPLKIDASSPALQAMSAQYNAIDSTGKLGFKKYLYMSSSAQSVDFDNPAYQQQVWRDISQAYFSFSSDYLEIPNMASYQGRFYQTDAHWNQDGSYQGYSELIRLIYGPSEPLVPRLELVGWLGPNRGSDAIRSNFWGFTENFYAYRFDWPRHSTTVDGVSEPYGKRDYYLPLAGDYTFPEHRSFYGEYYGYDTGLVVYDYYRPERPNALLIADSQGNCMEELVAVHFNQTHVFDLRHLDPQTPASIEQYMLENDITVLIRLSNEQHLAYDYEFALG
jgi:hypothetical protein